MLKAFRQNTLLQLVIILLAIALLWLKAFVAPVEMAPERYFAPLYGLLQSILAPFPILTGILALLLIVGEGIWLNIILANNKLNKANWLMPTLLFLLAMSWRGVQLTLTPILIASLPILASIRQLLSSGSTTLEVDRNFNAAFFIGIAVLCYLPAIAFVVPFFLVLVSYKSYHWRDFIVAILGLLAPFFIIFTYAFLTDKLDYYLILIRHDIICANFIVDTNSITDTVTNIIFIVLLLWALLVQLSSLSDMTIQQRINTTIFLLPIIAAILILPYETVFTTNTQFAAIPFAFIASNLLATEHKRKWINELLFWIILISPLVEKYFF